MNVTFFISDKTDYKPKRIKKDMEEQCVIFLSKDKFQKILRFKIPINKNKGTQVHKINMTTADPHSMAVSVFNIQFLPNDKSSRQNTKDIQVLIAYIN